VFPNADDSGPLDGRAFDRLVFRPALVRAEVAGFRWKDLRHTFATRLRMQNADLKSIGELMGHTTTRMTERYAHAAPGHLLAAVQRISRAATGTATDTRLVDEA
jgi:site-specific recombinase XerD